MKRKFGHTTIEAEDIQVVSVGYSDKGYGRIYTATIRSIKFRYTKPNIHEDKEIRISKAEYEKLAKEVCR